MKRFSIITIVLAMTLLISGFAFAMKDMDHGAMKTDDKAMTMHDSMKVMEDNLNMMKKDVEMAKNADMRKKAMGSMNKHMTDMHHGMEAAKGHAKNKGDKGMQDSMKQMDKEMMMLMKGMGKTKKDPDAGIPMMEDSIMKMEKTMMKMKGMM